MRDAMYDEHELSCSKKSLLMPRCLFKIDPKSGTVIKKAPHRRTRTPPQDVPLEERKKEKKKRRGRGHYVPRRASSGEATGGVLCTFSFSMARLLLFLPPFMIPWFRFFVFDYDYDYYPLHDCGLAPFRDRRGGACSFFSFLYIPFEVFSCSSLSWIWERKMLVE